MTDIYVAVWQAPSASQPWFSQELNVKLNALRRVAYEAKAQINNIHRSDYEGRWMLVAPEATFMSCEDESTRTLSNVTDLSHLKQRCEAITETYPGLLLIPGSILFVKKFYQTELYQEDPRKEPVALDPNTAEAKAIERLEKFYEARMGYREDAQELYERVLSEPTPRDKRTHREKQLEDLGKALKKFPLKKFKPEDVLSEEKRKTWLLKKAYMVRNIAYGYSGGQKRFAFKKRQNLEFKESLRQGLLFDPGSGDATWDWDGLTVGLEICADAGIGLLEAKGKEPDIYVIIADGQELTAVNPPSCHCQIFVDARSGSQISVRNTTGLDGEVVHEMNEWSDLQEGQFEGVDWGTLRVAKVTGLP